MYLNNSDLISIFSVLIACLSALYARQAVKESKHQNEISLHAERLNIYKGVTVFGSKLTSSGPTISEGDVWQFYDWVQLSEFYYNPPIHNRLDIAFAQALAMLSKNDEWRFAQEENNPNVKDLNDERYLIHRGLRDECFSVADSMKESLRIGKAK